MKTYYNPEDLSKFGDIAKEAPELARRFFEYYNAAFAEGELSEREKALIALGVAHALQCPYCISVERFYHRGRLLCGWQPQLN